ncbi:hypothetical protein [Flavobacterium gelatinilyticum]|uniref:hypothetical protein n=1 Tax=Flavobacterium gelatinilyticum TaxID=3003260 RepID=UPI002480E627|nr:hypothetical protein [Flavobacterium gelatinilyticum]
MENLPLYIAVFFELTTLLTLMLFLGAVRNSSSASVRQYSFKIFIGLILWLFLQAVLALENVYSFHTERFPPAILVFGIFPAIFTVCVLFGTKKGRRFVDSLPISNLTFLQIVRVPVEIILYLLFLNRAVPELMTFAGRNFDIVAGVTSPLIAYFVLIKRRIGSWALLVWNFICLGLLINIVINAFLSAPSPVQRFAFDQPNIAILHFPFSWLPAFIVPVVLFGHLASIRLLLKHLSRTREESNAEKAVRNDSL